MKRIDCYGSGSTAVVLHTEPDEAEALAKALPVKIVNVRGVDWNCDLSPWAAPAVFKGGDDFSGGADAHLKGLLDLLSGISVDRMMIAGYSMAGLFALYAALKCPMFEGVASVSGSLWFPGFTDWMQTAPYVPKRFYCSVGAKEKKSAAFRNIEECTSKAAEYLMRRGTIVNSVLEPGGHFHDCRGRMLRALYRLTEEES